MHNIHQKRDRHTEKETHTQSKVNRHTACKFMSQNLETQKYCVMEHLSDLLESV